MVGGPVLAVMVTLPVTVMVSVTVATNKVVVMIRFVAMRIAPVTNVVAEMFSQFVVIQVQIALGTTLQLVAHAVAVMVAIALPVADEIAGLVFPAVLVAELENIAACSLIALRKLAR
jgi:hypothetical protein